MKRFLTGTMIAVLCLLAETSLAAECRPSVRSEIVAMIKDDQLARDSPDPKVWDAVDIQNRPKLISIIRKYGVPTYSCVAKRVADDFVVLVLHQDLELMKEVLPQLRVAVDHSDSDKKNYAYLYDRVMSEQNQPQSWGTQGICKSGSWQMYPLKDADSLDERRRLAGLPPMSKYKKLVDQACKEVVQ